MPTPRHHAATATVDGKMYIIRGRVAGTLPITNVNVTKMYDPEMDKWTILDRIPTKRSESSAASIDNTIYVFEGKDITKTYNNTKNTILKLIDGNPRNHSLLRVMDCLPYLLIIKSLL